jgi:glycosyltransferase involved in cell wall biosynthesis
MVDHLPGDPPGSRKASGTILSTAGLVSVITPTLNEAELLPARARELALQEPPWEWIVADGGSHDGTTELALTLGARLVVSPPGRGTQLAAATRAAAGDFLLFLHADTALPPNAVATIRAVLAAPGVVGGNFTLRFGQGRFVDRFLGVYYRLQQQLLGLFFGDSALFARKAALLEAGGIPETALFEDLEAVRRLRRTGRLVKLPLVVQTSDRRYRGRVARTVALWTALLALYKAGAPPGMLARLYPPHRTRAD